jgi:hypothetical protein
MPEEIGSSGGVAKTAAPVAVDAPVDETKSLEQLEAEAPPAPAGRSTPATDVTESLEQAEAEAPAATPAASSTPGTIELLSAGSGVGAGDTVTGSPPKIVGTWKDLMSTVVAGTSSKHSTITANSASLVNVVGGP